MNPAHRVQTKGVAATDGVGDSDDGSVDWMVAVALPLPRVSNLPFDNPMKASLTISIFIALSFSSLATAANTPEPSGFHFFADKRGQQIEAQLVSIDPDRRNVQIRRRDGQLFDLQVTLLSLDDQQFVREWLFPKPDVPVGKLRIYGTRPKAEPIDVTIAEGINDFVEVYALKAGWVGRRINGEVFSSTERFHGLKDLRDLYLNTVWASFVEEDGSVWTGTAQRTSPEGAPPAVKSAAVGPQRIAILEDGSVKVWGGKTGSESLIDPPVAISNAIDVATTQGVFAVLTKDGKVHTWKPEETEVKTAMIGSGAVDIEGAAFRFLALTRDGEVYQFGGGNPAGANIPGPLKEEKDPFIKVRSAGVTFAAQRENGTWLAWGKNGTGIVDHINSLGPVPDLAFVNEPVKDEYGFVVWIDTGAEP